MEYSQIGCGAEQSEKYLKILQKKKVAVVTNASGRIGTKHLVDSLLLLGVKIVKIFSPEHGFRGHYDAGEKIMNTKDSVTGITVVSLYGKKIKPDATDIKEVDVVLFDIQDVGVRFYTYLSTLHYVMEACAEFKKPLIVLDRPNPNGFYVDGPVLKKEFRSFLGLHPVPIVYGMTIGEYALMINGQQWLAGKKKCNLTVIPCRNYHRNKTTRLPIPPSPNLNSHASVLLYPTLGLLEGTSASVGRGTPFPFCVIGHPQFPDTGFCFNPRSNAISKHPLYEGQRCCGFDLSGSSYLVHHPRRMELEWIRNFALGLKKDDFFNKYFPYHAGNNELQHQLISHISLEEIRSGWKKELEEFKKIRKKYLLYPDFDDFDHGEAHKK